MPNNAPDTISLLVLGGLACLLMLLGLYKAVMWLSGADKRQRTVRAAKRDARNLNSLATLALPFSEINVKQRIGSSSNISMDDFIRNGLGVFDYFADQCEEACTNQIDLYCGQAMQMIDDENSRNELRDQMPLKIAIHLEALEERLSEVLSTPLHRAMGYSVAVLDEQFGTKIARRRMSRILSWQILACLLAGCALVIYALNPMPTVQVTSPLRAIAFAGGIAILMISTLLTVVRSMRVTKELVRPRSIRSLIGVPGVVRPRNRHHAELIVTSTGSSRSTYAPLGTCQQNATELGRTGWTKHVGYGGMVGSGMSRSISSGSATPLAASIGLSVAFHVLFEYGPALIILGGEALKIGANALFQWMTDKTVRQRRKELKDELVKTYLEVKDALPGEVNNRVAVERRKLIECLELNYRKFANHASGSGNS